VRKVEAIFEYLRDRAVVLVSAQLPVGTVAALERSFAGVAHRHTVSFACSPENLRLGRAIEIFRNPGGIVIGVRDRHAREVLLPLLSRFCDNLIWTSIESAEWPSMPLTPFSRSALASPMNSLLFASRLVRTPPMSKRRCAAIRGLDRMPLCAPDRRLPAVPWRGTFGF
jgi:hypothetical protein